MPTADGAAAECVQEIEVPVQEGVCGLYPEMELRLQGMESNQLQQGMEPNQSYQGMELNRSQQGLELNPDQVVLSYPSSYGSQLPPSPVNAHPPTLVQNVSPQGGLPMHVQSQ